MNVTGNLRAHMRIARSVLSSLVKVTDTNWPLATASIVYSASFSILAFSSDWAMKSQIGCPLYPQSGHR